MRFAVADDCPLVLIEWEDSRQPSGQWVYLSAIAEDHSPVLCATVGWLIKDTAEVKVVCQSMADIDKDDDMQAGGVMVIPARCVLSIARLEEVTSSETGAVSEPKPQPISELA
jgi:hypothetical protein